MALHQVVLQDINKSSQYVHLGVKMYWIPPAPLWFSTTVITLMLGILHTEKIMHKFENWEYLHSAMAGKRKYKQFHVALGKCNPSDALQKKKKICNFLKITQRMNLKFLNLSTPSLSGNNERAAMVGVSCERAAMAGVSLLLKPWNWFQISSYLLGGWRAIFGLLTHGCSHVDAMHVDMYGVQTFVHSHLLKVEILNHLYVLKLRKLIGSS